MSLPSSRLAELAGSVAMPGFLRWPRGEANSWQQIHWALPATTLLDLKYPHPVKTCSKLMSKFMSKLHFMPIWNLNMIWVLTAKRNIESCKLHLFLSLFLSSVMWSSRLFAGLISFTGFAFTISEDVNLLHTWLSVPQDDVKSYIGQISHQASRQLVFAHSSAEGKAQATHRGNETL